MNSCSVYSHSSAFLSLIWSCAEIDRASVKYLRLELDNLAYRRVLQPFLLYTYDSSDKIAYRGAFLQLDCLGWTHNPNQ